MSDDLRLVVLLSEESGQSASQVLASWTAEDMSRLFEYWRDRGSKP